VITCGNPEPEGSHKPHCWLTNPDGFYQQPLIMIHPDSRRPRGSERSRECHGPASRPPTINPAPAPREASKRQLFSNVIQVAICRNS
jgi:hypothetical protein